MVPIFLLHPGILELGLLLLLDLACTEGAHVTKCGTTGVLAVARECTKHISNQRQCSEGVVQSHGTIIP